MRPFPITAKLNAFAGMRNLAYLAEIAALTRMMTGVVRVLQNKPSKFKDPNLSQNQKRQAFLERFFVEIIGTSGYIFFLHLGQDLFAKLFEARAKLQKLPYLAATTQGLTKNEIALANEAIRDVYGPHSAGFRHEGQGLIYRVLYGDELQREAEVTIGDEVKKVTQSVVQKANLSTLHEKLGDELFAKVRQAAPHLDQFTRSINKAASVSVLGGVVLSALYGGVMTQWVNDRVIAPIFKKFLKKRYGDDGTLDGGKKPGTPQIPGVPVQRPPNTAEPLGVKSRIYQPAINRAPALPMNSQPVNYQPGLTNMGGPG